jgi:hypothetical protein
MKSLADWLVVIFMFMFWAFRVVVEYMYSTGRTFFVTPINETTEIILLFVTLFCIFLVIKREHIGGIIYFISYALYFGTDLYKNVKVVLDNNEPLSSISAGYSNIFFSAVAIVLSLIVMIDLLSDHLKRPDDKKTEWFYNNKDLDRKVDERDDKNHYRLS